MVLVGVWCAEHCPRQPDRLGTLVGGLCHSWSIYVPLDCIWGYRAIDFMCKVVLPQNRLKYIVILGAQIRGKKITGSLKRRLDRGLRYLQENPDTICIVSGGKGRGEDISEAEAMADYLKACGIQSERIYKEDKSTTTWENLTLSASYIEDLNKDKIGIISNNFHIYRAMKMARILGYKKVFALPASTNMVVFPNYMVREFFALFVMISEVKKSADA